MIDLRPWLDVFVPIAAIGLFISLALIVLHYLADAIVSIAKRDIERPTEERQEHAPLEVPMDEFWNGFNQFMGWAAGPQTAKRKNEDTEPEEKPKRKNEEFMLGAEGELIEVSDDDSLTLDDLLDQSTEAT